MLIAAAASQTTFASTPFLLGIDYTVDLGSYFPGLTAMATDASGALYLMASSLVVKVSPDATQAIWSFVPGFAASENAVDANGDVYLAGWTSTSEPTPLVAKLAPDGSAIVAQVPLDFAENVSAIAVDPQGRLWIGGYCGSLATTANALQGTVSNTNAVHGFVVRLNAAGTAIEYATYIGGSNTSNVTGVAVDQSGRVYIAGTASSPDFVLDGGFLAQMTPDGASLTYTVAVPVPLSNFVGVALALDAAGDAAVAVEDTQGIQPISVARYDSTGALVFSETLPLRCYVPCGLGIDSSGNTYVSGSATGNFPVKNSIAPCATSALSVRAPDGTVLQSTWLPAGDNGFLAPDGSVYTVILASEDASLPPPRTVLVGMPSGRLLTHLSTSAPATPLPLACITDPASFGVGSPVVPGGILTLFGSGLGPQTGAIPNVTVQSGFPEELDGVQVLFDDRPAPLLYVQDGQINAVAPWSLTPGATTNVCVSFNAALSNCLSANVVESYPVAFQNAYGFAAALNQDGTINSATNPAPAGSIVSIFATGLGPLNPPPQDGAVLVPSLPMAAQPISAAVCIQVFSGGFPLSSCHLDPIQYAGPAPFQVAGLFQINLTAGPIGSWMILSAGGAGSSDFQVYLSSGN